MRVQLLALAVGLVLGRSLGDQRQQPLGRQVIDQLRLVLAEMRLVQLCVHLGGGRAELAGRLDRVILRRGRDAHDLAEALPILLGRIRRRRRHALRHPPLQLPVGFQQRLDAQLAGCGVAEFLRDLGGLRLGRRHGDGRGRLQQVCGHAGFLPVG